jgi:predicted enzyme related to lactoylglutathione lyase
MLREHPIHAVIPATDLERARAFYADKLGLTPTREEPAGLVYVTYRAGQLQTVDGIATTQGGRAAWFKDSEGNILGLAQTT